MIGALVGDEAATTCHVRIVQVMMRPSTIDTP
jgi:hypothetical protein